MSTQDELFTVDEAASLLKVSRWTMYRLMKERHVVGVLVGTRCRRITRASVSAYLAELVEAA